MSNVIDRVTALKGAVAPVPFVPRARRPYATPALLFRVGYRIDDVELEVHVLDHPDRKPPAQTAAKFLEGRNAGIGLDRYVSRTTRHGVPPLGQSIRYFRPVIPIAPGYNHAMRVEFLAAFQRPRVDRLFARPPGEGPPPMVVHDATVGPRSPQARSTLAARAGKFALGAAERWRREFLGDEFWRELARMEGVVYQPKCHPLALGRKTVVFMRPAAPTRWDRKDPPRHARPRLLENHDRWLAGSGRVQVTQACERTIAAMKWSDDHATLRTFLGGLFDRP
ncbi:MAG: hypothetical protein ABS79_00530 [Planctomycetes bacterium SCN 63-9]|nr:MAG: hypothetical protein ABS79_00530 [Planctomycetes bacterium SCN 63-9]